MTDKQFVTCRKCKGAGQVDAEFNELDLLMESFSSASKSELDDIIDVAMNRANVKKGRRPHVGRAIKLAFEILQKKL